MTQPQADERGLTTGVLLLMLGAFEVAIIYVLLAVETPISNWARREAETWPGRLLLAVIGLAVISTTMIVVLTFAERRRARRGADSPT